MKAMIFAAGLGTRLKPFTDTKPKALFEVNGKPLIEHVMGGLKATGLVDSFVVNVHHFPEQIRSWLEEHVGEFPEVAVSDESERLLDTGGAIRHAEKLLRGGHVGVGSSDGSGVRSSFGGYDSVNGSFLVHNVDIFTNLDLKWFLSQEREGALATLHVSDRPTSRYFLFDEDMRLVGWINDLTGDVRSPDPELCVEKCIKLAFSGIHLISRDVFDVIRDVDQAPMFYPIWTWNINKKTGPLLTCDEPLGDRFPIVDFYLRVAQEYDIFGAFDPDFRMIDAGKADKLDDVLEFVKSL